MKNSADKLLTNELKNNLKNIKADEQLINSTLELLRNIEAEEKPTKLSAINSSYVKEKQTSRKKINYTLISLTIAASLVLASSVLLRLMNEPVASESAVGVIEENTEKVIYTPYAVSEREYSHSGMSEMASNQRSAVPVAASEEMQEDTDIEKIELEEKMITGNQK